MKKIISALVAMLMILSSLSAFAAIEVDNFQPSKSYFNDLSSFADGAAAASPFSFNGETSRHGVEYEFKDGQFNVRRKSGITSTGITYLYCYNLTGDTFTFGYDIKFSNIPDNPNASDEELAVYSNKPGTSSTVFSDADQAMIDSGDWVVGTLDKDGAYLPGEVDTKNDSGNWKRKASKTSWCFQKSGTDLVFKVKKDKDGNIIKGDNGQPAIFFGDAKLEQDAFYTMKVYVDQTTKTYRAVIIDSNGNLFEAGNGTVQNAFNSMGKMETFISAYAGDNGTVTLDNIFNSNMFFDLRVGDTSEVSPAGTIGFSATLPATLVNPAVYINDTFVESLTLTPGSFEDYNLTVALPDGTALGQAKIEIRGTINGEAVSVSDTTVLSKTYKTFTKVLDTPTVSGSAKGLRAFASGGKIDVDSTDSGVWTITATEKTNEDGSVTKTCGGQVDVTDIEPMLTGVVDYSFDFKSNSQITSLRLRMTANTSNGDAMKWNGGADTYHYFENGYPYGMGTKDIAYDSTQWNTLRIRADFYNHKYYAYINGTLCEEGTFTDHDETWTTVDSKTGDTITHRPTNGVDDVRFIIHCADKETGVIYLDNFKFEEYRLTSNLAAATVAAKYVDGSTSAYDGVALDALNVTGFDFATPIAFDAASIPANTKIVNSAGEVIPATFSFANGTISATYAGAVLPTDNYKLVVSKNATILGAAVGAAYEVPFALNSDDRALIEDGTVVTDKINLSAFAGSATKVVFKVNDETVKTFAAPEADGMYEFLYTPTAIGKNIFDAYVYTNSGVNVVSKTFTYVLDGEAYGVQSNVESNLDPAGAATANLVSGAGNDGSSAVLLTSKCGTLINGAINIDDSNSCWTGLGNAQLYRKFYIEIELKPGENTKVFDEVGFNKKGLKSTKSGDGYTTPDLRGRGSQHMFGSNGTILGTSVKYTPNKWYKFCHLIDCEEKISVWNVYTNNDENPDYETLVLSVSDTLPTSLTSGYESTLCVYSKYKILLLPNDFSKSMETETKQVATVYIDNYKRYMPIAQPVVETVTANGTAVVNDVITKGTDAVTVVLDNEYSSLTAADIAVTVDGAAVGTVTVADNKTFTISGLSTIAEGKKINVKLADTLSVVHNYAEGSSESSVSATVKGAYEFNLFVGDSNGVCFYPLSVESATGGYLTAYAKYINGSQNALNTYLIMTEYANDDKTLVRQTNFAPLAIAAGKVGAVSGYLGDIVKAEGCNVMLWNTDFAPLLEAGALNQ